VTLHGINRRHRRTQKKRPRNPHAPENMAKNALLERFEINNNVRELRHLRIPSGNSAHYGLQLSSVAR
jgi:hypothetical protein